MRHIRIGGHAASLSSDFGEPFAVAVEQGQQGTFRREKLGGSPPDPGRGARDQDPPAESVADIGGAVAIFTISAVACLATRRRWPALAVYSGAVAVFLVWWATISPARDRDWVPNVARTLTATINGDRVVLSNVRNFNWRSETDFDPIWEQRTYYLSRVTDVDLIMSYWMGEAIAHTIISFGFDVAPDLRSR